MHSEGRSQERRLQLHLRRNQLHLRRPQMERLRARRSQKLLRRWLFKRSLQKTKMKIRPRSRRGSRGSNTPTSWMGTPSLFFFVPTFCVITASLKLKSQDFAQLCNDSNFFYYCWNDYGGLLLCYMWNMVLFQCLFIAIHLVLLLGLDDKFKWLYIHFCWPLCCAQR